MNVWTTEALAPSPRFLRKERRRVSERMPQHLRDMPVEVQVAVLYERVGNLAEEVHSLKRALWALVFSVLTSMIVFLFVTVAAGWIGGPHP